MAMTAIIRFYPVMENNTKQYLGDSVYAEIQDGIIKLTTENGHGASNTICLEPEVWRSLQLYVQEANQPCPNSTGQPPSLAKAAGDKPQEWTPIVIAQWLSKSKLELVAKIERLSAELDEL